MTISTAFVLRNLIGNADRAARAERTETIESHSQAKLSRLPVLDREIDLAATAAVALWETRGATNGNTEPLIKLWRALDRAYRIAPDRWIPVVSEVRKIFRSSCLTPTAI